MKKLDFILIGIYVFVTVIFSLFLIITPSTNYSQKYVLITINNEEYMRINLPVEGRKEIVIENKYGKNVVLIENDTVEMYDSDCFDKICVLEGKKSKVGDIIACLPHRLLVEIKGIKKDEIDGISY